VAVVRTVEAINNPE
jgi:hypothetical protein